MSNQYRKKPVVIEAFQMTEARRMDNSEWPNWLNEAWNKNEGDSGALFRKDMDAPMPDLLCIWTLEGVHLVDWGDWIIRGVKGELYPCKPDIFAATYEPADFDATPGEEAHSVVEWSAERVATLLAQRDAPPKDGTALHAWAMQLVRDVAAQQAAQPVASIADWEEIGTVLASVADNLGDMPISDEWAAKTAKRAWSLLERNNYFRAAQPVAGEPATHEVPRAWRQALRKLAFMARTSGGTAGPDSGLMAALDEAEALLSQPYRHTAAPVPVEAFDFTAHLHRQQQFSAKTFGPGKRVQGVTDHIAKELAEVRESDGDLSEWIDVVILGLDGALRCGATPEQVVAALIAKQAKNESRRWPDWRTADPNKAIEHDRSQDGAKESA